LHLATHGFFLENQVPTNQSNPVEQMERLTGIGLENPMLRSGLALAGANTWLRNGVLPPEVEDGILTAEDVAGLDLSNTDLTVLSACETGLGDIQTGEGVFGLRRAFMLAGTKALIMSLWSVPDKETQQLMESFYKLAIQGKPYAEAMREAQLNLRKERNSAFYWGAFVFQGEI
jgi:CHAT domain-containing protein